MRYRLLIFDLDGTLADSFPVFRRVMTEVIAHFRLQPVTEADLPALRRLGAREVIRRLGLPWWKVPRVARFTHRRMGEHLAEIPLFAGVAETLIALRGAGAELALVTSNSEANARAILGEPLAAEFRAMECGSSLFGKRARFEAILRRCRCERAAALCIGDELRDLEAARAAAIDFAAVTWGYTAPETLAAAGPEFLWAEPRDFLRLREMSPA